jgi:LysR family transcriptional regulator, flagellar master operon regulator
LNRIFRTKLMNLAALRTFLAVVETGNLNKAAARLNVTQSTVTARLDALDEALGHRLLVRSRKGAQLTKAGFAFQRHAELMLRTWDQARKAVGLPQGYSGMFSLACQPEVWEGAGERWMAGVQAAHGGLALEVWPGEMGEIDRWLGSGLVDAAITLTPAAADGLSSRELMRDRLVQVATGPSQAGASDEAYVYVDLGAEFRRQHSLARPADNTARMTFGSGVWALAHLLREGGTAYLPWRLAAPQVAAGSLRLVEGAAEFSRPIYLNWRQASEAQHTWLTANTPFAGNTAAKGRV